VPFQLGAFQEAGVVETRATERSLLAGGTVLYAVPNQGDRMAGGSPTPYPGGSPTPHQPPSSKLQMQLLDSPQRQILADGKDSAKIYAIISDENRDAPQSDVNLYLHNSIGTMAKPPLVIPAGHAIGSCSLVSTDIGSAEVGLDWSSPRVDGKNNLTIEFGPPIQRLKIEASAPSISLLDQPAIYRRVSRRKGYALSN